MANPPAPVTHTSTLGGPVTYGTVLHYGVSDITITGLLIESYKRNAKYAKVEEIHGQSGIVEGIRMHDYRAEVTVAGKAKESATFTIKVGDVLTINGDKILINAVDLSATATGFATIDIKGTAYEGVTGLEPA